MEQTVSCRRGGDRMGEGEGISKRTCMLDPWTQTPVWRCPEGGGQQGLGIGGHRRDK